MNVHLYNLTKDKKYREITFKDKFLYTSIEQEVEDFLLKSEDKFSDSLPNIKNALRLLYQNIQAMLKVFC